MTFFRKILAIECTHQCISVAVSLPDGVVVRTLHEWRRTAESIVPLVDSVLAESGLVREAIDAVAVSSGPGSFTALRIGMATAKGIAFGTGCPLVPVSTIEALAFSALGQVRDGLLIPVVPARKGEFYYALYSPDGDAVREMSPVTYVPVTVLKDVFMGMKEPRVFVARDTGPLEALAEEIGADLLQADFFTAASLLPFAEKKLSSGKPPSLESVTPDYQQKFRSGG
ncbi:tRNA (adenosine(37)-N6)-threonylcarbamoyltransferase complex dimerization subunit type 1 TsaB [Prosthecochloris sp. GSB1]|uniref:tRNA (adenosine(37)-N6)-threonylcarbamoyltransferase complex dimerization subunit type 1 TsaB n=1 Tax=Prosthecochloris sp. GSB1 TaxID=281093 RepID=UPI00142D6675|nr:tRNA (adenosine(37)-N6)-threonylcarbamoyltransferase complex dimerization subunit type 1 TsaB [Prosthecochloris sp. GSB1]